MSKKSADNQAADSNQKPSSHKKSGLSVQIEIEQLTRQVAELTEALQRERADAANIRRQHDQQIGGLKQLITVQAIEELLPVIDNFERALRHVPAELADNAYVKGVQGVVKQFESTLSGMGVQRIATVGQAFNPHLHEAVSAEGDGDSELISEELQAGYQLGDHVIRHAMVKVTRS